MTVVHIGMGAVLFVTSPPSAPPCPLCFGVVLAVAGLCSFALFQKRKPGGQNQWSEKLPDFVKRLESALFNSAQTKVGAL
jgi:hypothetical protein